MSAEVISMEEFNRSIESEEMSLWKSKKIGTGL